MRRLLPLALLLVACAKPQTPAVPAVEAPAKPPAAASANLTPESLAKAMDVPLYPGAEAPDRMSSMPETRPDKSVHYSLVLATTDDVDKVAAWYEKQLGLKVMPGMGGKSIVGKTKTGNDVIVTIGPEAGRTMIRVKAIKY